MNPDTPTQETTEITSTAASPEPKKGPKFLVRHFGLNRKQRGELGRTMRLAKNGSSEKNRARKLLGKSPANHPIRVAWINRSKQYLPEPIFFQLLAELAAQKQSPTNA